MKKHYEGEHSNIWKVYFSEISLWHSTKNKSFWKKNSKVWKMVNLGSIFTFSSNTTSYKKSQEEQKDFKVKT
jgi:hypothetical protein